MKIVRLFSFVATLVFSISAFSAAPSSADFSKINLEGLKVIDKEGLNTLGYAIKQIAKPSRALIATLEGEAYSVIVSPIFELNQTSSFKNIYVYIGKKDDGVFELVIAQENKSGSIFVIDMDITDVSKTELKMQHGPSDEIEVLTATRAPGALFP